MAAPSASALPSFFFNDTATTEISTLSLHDALPIYAIDPRKRTTLYWQGQAFNDTVSPTHQGQFSAQWSFTTHGVTTRLAAPTPELPAHRPTRSPPPPAKNKAARTRANKYMCNAPTG